MHQELLRICLGLLASGSIAQAADLYVSPEGRDSNSGIKGSPLASLEGARLKIAAEELAAEDPVMVWVRGGTYHLTKPFRLGAKDSGTKGAPIIYRAVPGEEVLLKGSLPLDSKAWKPWNEGIFKQSLKGTVLEGKDINQLFMSDKRMVRARYPNWDFENPLRTGKGYLHAGGSEKPSMEKIEWVAGDLEERVARWKNPELGIVHAFHRSNWGNFQFRIKEIDVGNRLIHFGDGGWQAQRRYGVGVKHKGVPGSPYYIENIFEELDAPFEWFHDVETQTLYFKPPADVSLRDVSVEAVVLDRLIECKGAKHVHFDGFHLTQTRTTFMDAYDDLARGDWAIHRGGAVHFLNSEDCSVKDFHIEQVGGNGIFVDGFNDGIHISGCLIEDTGESSVCFVGNPKAVRDYQTWEKAVNPITDLEPGPKTEDYPRSCSVTNSILRDAGVYGKQTSGVIVSMAMDITIDHCSVYRIARAGITFNDGTWGGHVMSNCDIYDTILDTGEHGPFNAWGRERFWRGTKLNKALVKLDAMKPVKLHHNRVGNYRSGVSAGNWTIDLDDGSSNFEITDNLMLGSTLKLRDGYFRTVTNNIMVSAVPTGFHCWPEDGSDDVFNRNITVIAGAAEGGRGASKSMISPARMPSDIALWGRLDRNLWWNMNASEFSAGPPASSMAAWQEKQGAHDIIANPQFVDPANRNYQVRETSPALKLGFKNFPMDQFGHRMTRIMHGSREFAGQCKVEIRADARGGEVRYTVDGSAPSADSALYREPLVIRNTTTLRAGTFDAEGRAVGFPDDAVLTKVEEVSHQSWLASVLAGKTVMPPGSVNSHPGSKPGHVTHGSEYALPAVTGQIVRIELPGKKRTLSLAEVEVFANGTNVALQGKAAQINTRRDAAPERAIDGITDGDYLKGSVTHTEEGIANPWWEVDLGRPVQIEKIVVSNRTTHQNRLDQFTLKILDAKRNEVFAKADCSPSARIVFAPSGKKEPASFDWAGLHLVTISDYPDYIDASGGQTTGAFVTRIKAGSLAATAGLKNGDTIVGANGMEVGNVEDLKKVLSSKADAVKCKVFRGYKHFEFTINRGR